MDAIEKGNTVGIKMTWIVVKDLDKAIQFYTDIVGLTLINKTPEYGWAELAGNEGSTLGIAQESPLNPIKAGMNGVTTVTVNDLEEACKKLIDSGAKLIGEVEEVPGHVRMQTFVDADGNMGQLAQML